MCRRLKQRPLFASSTQTCQPQEDEGVEKPAKFWFTHKSSLKICTNTHNGQLCIFMCLSSRWLCVYFRINFGVDRTLWINWYTIGHCCRQMIIWLLYVATSCSWLTIVRLTAICVCVCVHKNSNRFRRGAFEFDEPMWQALIDRFEIFVCLSRINWNLLRHRILD